MTLMLILFGVLYCIQADLEAKRTPCYLVCLTIRHPQYLQLSVGTFVSNHFFQLEGDYWNLYWVFQAMRRQSAFSSSFYQFLSRVEHKIQSWTSCDDSYSSKDLCF